MGPMPEASRSRDRLGDGHRRHPGRFEEQAGDIGGLGHVSADDAVAPRAIAGRLPAVPGVGATPAPPGAVGVCGGSDPCERSDSSGCRPGCAGPPPPTGPRRPGRRPVRRSGCSRWPPRRAGPGSAVTRSAHRSADRRGARLAALPDLTSTMATEASILGRPSDGQVHPGRELDGAVGQHDPQRLLRPWHPARVQRRPAADQAAGLALDFGLELVPLGPGQLLDPRRPGPAGGRRPRERPGRRPPGRRSSPR